MRAPAFENKHLIETFGKEIGKVIFYLGRLIMETFRKIERSRLNSATYSILLENDDYLLRDIGVSREDIRRLSARKNTKDAKEELARIRRERSRYL